MKVFIGRLILKLTGWRIQEDKTYHQYPKAVLIAAPHTSNWDFFFMLCSMWALKIPGRFLIKDDHTKGVFGGLLKALGAIGIDRSQKTNFVDYAVNLLKKENKLVLIVPPEGTRKKVEKWKTGFYNIAKGAEVPIILSFLDYGKRKLGVLKFVSTKDGTFEEVMEEIQEYYKDISGKIPENFNPNIY